MGSGTYRAGAVLAGAAVAQAAVSFVAFGLPAIGPELREEFGLTLSELGAVLTASILGSGAGLVAVGVAVERVGTRRTTLMGTSLGAGGLVAGALSSSKVSLFAALLASGVGSAVVPVAGAGALFRAYPATRRGWALGVRQMAVPLGGMLAALLLPALHAVGGVRLPLLVAAAAVGASGLALAVLAGTDGSGRRGTGERAFRTILRAPGMTRLLTVAALYIAVLQALMTYAVPAVRAAGLSSFTASATFFALNVTAMVARVVWGRVADRRGGARRSRTLVDLGVIAAGGGVLFTAALHAPAPVTLLAAAIFGFGALGWNGIVYVSAGERTRPDLAGRAFAVAATVVFVLSAVFTPVLGSLADRFGWSALWLTTAALALAGAILSRSLHEPHAPV